MTSRNTVLSFVAAGVLAATSSGQELRWLDAHTLTVEGQGWNNTSAPWDRLPARARTGVRPEVWDLSQHSAGVAVRFVARTESLSARWKLTSPRLALPHMCAAGVSGLDLYARDDHGHFRWVAATKPTAQENLTTFFRGVKDVEREYLLYLPLYNGTRSLELGVPENAKITPAPPRPQQRRRPIVFYGTSITHGACASRPGMTHVAILGRRLDWPVVNLGFSGNGRMEAEVARLLAELDAAVYVIDCLPNLRAEQVRERTRPLVEILRTARPETPILLVEDRDYSNGWFLPSRRAHNRANQKALRAAHESMQRDGVQELHYLAGPELLGADGDATVDSSHPTDLGFFRQANALEVPLRRILRQR